MNLIGDIAGEFEAFQKLVKAMPEGPVVAVGDLCDRGPDSRRVMDWFMEGRGVALMGNHDLLFLRNVERPKFSEMRMWLDGRNGGAATLKNFGRSEESNWDFHVPEEYVTWCKGRPYYYEGEDFIATHAPLPEWASVAKIKQLEREMPWEDWCQLWGELVWNRYCPVRHEKFQVFGHNGTLESHSDEEGDFAICIDNSHKGELVGLHFETDTLYRVPLGK